MRLTMNKLLNLHDVLNLTSLREWPEHALCERLEWCLEYLRVHVRLAQAIGIFIRRVEDQEEATLVSDFAWRELLEPFEEALQGKRSIEIESVLASA